MIFASAPLYVDPPIGLATTAFGASLLWGGADAALYDTQNGNSATWNGAVVHADEGAKELFTELNNFFSDYGWLWG